MSGGERCAGCHRRGGALCPECLLLAGEAVAVRRALGLPVLCLVVGVAVWLPLLVRYLLGWEAGFLGHLAYYLGATGVASIALGWGVQDLARPRAFAVDRHLRITWPGGLSEDLDLGEVADDHGVVVWTTENRRWPVGELRFPGAARFHRALRAKLAARELGQTA